MRCCIFANACKPSTTILEKLEGNRHEKALVGARTEVRTIRRLIRYRVGLCGAGVVELADAGSFWLAFDQLLAGGRDFGSEQDPVRRLPGPRWPALLLASPHDRAVGADDAGGAREVPSGHAWALRVLRIACGGAEGLSAWGFLLK